MKFEASLTGHSFLGPQQITSYIECSNFDLF